MIITFCGHSQLYSNFDKEKYKQIIFDIFNQEIKKDDVVDFYLGGYGQFDLFALACCNEYKKINKNSKTIFVTPYIEEEYLKRRELLLKDYDEIIYADIEKVPKRYAIAQRNFWMVDNAHLVISYIEFTWGGAYKTYQHAKQQKKKLINIFVNQ